MFFPSYVLDSGGMSAAGIEPRLISLYIEHRRPLLTPKIAVSPDNIRENFQDRCESMQRL